MGSCFRCSSKPMCVNRLNPVVMRKKKYKPNSKITRPFDKILVAISSCTVGSPPEWDSRGEFSEKCTFATKKTRKWGPLFWREFRLAGKNQISKKWIARDFWRKKSSQIYCTDNTVAPPLTNSSECLIFTLLNAWTSGTDFPRRFYLT